MLMLKRLDFTSWAILFSDIFLIGANDFERNFYLELYYWIPKVTRNFDDALFTIYEGNQTPYYAERNLEPDILTMIENVTTNIENLTNKTDLLISNGVEPTQQLRDAGVLTDVINYLEQMFENSCNIGKYYGYGY